MTPRRTIRKSDSTDESEPPTKRQKVESENEDQTYTVNKIVGDRIYKGKKQYKIRWEGFAAKYDTWETEDRIFCKDEIKRYREKKKKAASLRTASRLLLKRTTKNLEKKNMMRFGHEVRHLIDHANEFVVDRIYGGRMTSNGKKEYLVKWNGVSMWEPSESFTYRIYIDNSRPTHPDRKIGRRLTKLSAPVALVIRISTFDRQQATLKMSTDTREQKVFLDYDRKIEEIIRNKLKLRNP